MAAEANDRMEEEERERTEDKVAVGSSPVRPEDYDDEEIMEMRDAEPYPHDEKSEQSGGRTSPLLSMFGEVTVFRDFFLAAFSDGYNSVRYCCCSRACAHGWRTRQNTGLCIFLTVC